MVKMVNYGNYGIISTIQSVSNSVPKSKFNQGQHLNEGATVVL